MEPPMEMPDQHGSGMRENYGNSGGNSGAIQGNSGAFSAIRVPGGCQNASVAAIRAPESLPL